MKRGSGGEVEGVGWVEESGGEVVMLWLLGSVCVCRMKVPLFN